MTEQSKGERIAKIIARAGHCSRRDAEKLILGGCVSCNGITVDSPVHFVTPEDQISINGNPLNKPKTEKLWLFYKPVGLITTHKDPQGRQTVFDYAQEQGLPHVVSVGRLDINSEGLLLLTTSSAFAHNAESPKTAWPRTYRVRIFGKPNVNQLMGLSKGITIEGINYDPIQVEWENDLQADKRNNWIRMTLTEGKNREIRKILNHFDLEVNRLIRISYGPYELGTLKPGELKQTAILKANSF
jgi:23S rRNA pseudouridine2605 synthase